MPKISIIVPVYNVEPYLRKCLDSLLAQTLKDIEIILIDDGSTDASDEICDEYARNDARIRIIHKSNEGLSCARNDGIEMSTATTGLIRGSVKYHTKLLTVMTLIL